MVLDFQFILTHIIPTLIIKIENLIILLNLNYLILEVIELNFLTNLSLQRI